MGFLNARIMRSGCGGAMEGDRWWLSPLAGDLDITQGEVGIQLESDRGRFLDRKTSSKVWMGIAPTEAILTLSFCKDGTLSPRCLLQCCQVEPDPH
jgi:hypothetical protein